MAKGGWFTLGVEEEFQIVDPISGELRSHIEQVLEDGRMVLKESFKSEMHKSVVEAGTGICQSCCEAKAEVLSLRKQLSDFAGQHKLTIASAGTHPTSSWWDQEITEGERYQELVRELQQAARKNLIFGLHVHVGFPDRENAIHVINAARYFVPHVLALAGNSPYWVGMDTGYKSYRVKVFEGFPRTGLPHHFRSLSEYEDYIKVLVKTGCIDNPKRVWWDLRLHPFLDTIEWRVCDAQLRVDETIALAALMQALTAKLYKLVSSNLNFRIYRRLLEDENRFRAARFGIQGKLIDFGKNQEVPFKSLLEELMEFVDPVVDELGCRKEIDYIWEMMKNGTGADRQVRVYEKTKSLKSVIDYIIEETHRGLPDSTPLEKKTKKIK